MADPITILQVVSAVISIGAAVYAASITPPDQSDVGAHITKQGISASRNRVYGRTLVSGTSVYSNVRNDDHAIRLDVFSIGGIGELKYIHNVYIDDKPMLPHDINFKSDNTNPSSGIFRAGDLAAPFSAQCDMQIRNGNLHESAMQLAIDNSDGEWTTRSRGDYVPQLAVTARRIIDEDGIVILGDSYVVYVDATGGDVFDPVNNIMVDSSNPAWATLDFLNDRYYGMSIGYDYIDLQSFNRAAEFCRRNNLTIRAEVNMGDSIAQILSDMLSTFGGTLSYYNGKLVCVYEDVEIPLYDFDPDNVVGESFSVIEQGGSDYFNVINVEYKSEPNREKVDKFTLPTDIENDPTIQKDGKIIEKTLKLPYTVDGELNGETVRVSGAAKFFANREFNRIKLLRGCKFDVDLLEYPLLRIGSVITVTLPEHNWYKKPYRVTNMVNSLDDERLSIATVTFDQYDDSVYSGNLDGVGSKPKPLPPVVPPAPVDLKFDLLSYTTGGYGTLSWQVNYYAPNIEYHVEYRLHRTPDNLTWTRAGSTTETFYKLSNLRPDTYDFRVRTFHLISGTSAWTVLENQHISAIANFPAVTGVACDVSTKDFNVIWNDMSDAPIIDADPNSPDNAGGKFVRDYIKHYQVDVFHLQKGTYVFKESFVTNSNEYSYFFADNVKNGLNRSIRVDVKIVGVDGTMSPVGSGSMVNATNPQVPAPSGLSIKSNIAMVFFEWDQPAESNLDYRGTVVHMSDTPDFTPDEGNKLFDGVGSYIYYWNVPVGTKPPPVRYVTVGHYDIFGHDGIIYSPEKQVIYHAIDHVIEPFDPSQLEEQINSNTAAVEANEREIAANKNAIATNDRDIAANKDLIDTNKANIAQNDRDIAANRVVIDQNKANIAQNDRDIAANKVVIDKNKADIAKHELEIAANESIINQNKANIAQNDRDIAANQAEIDKIGTSVSGSIPNISNQLNQLRNPDNAPKVNNVPIQELIALVASPSKAKTAGWGLYSSNTVSKMIIAADHLIVGGGKGSNDNDSIAFSYSGGRLLLNNATVVNLNAGQLAAGSITSTQIQAGTITASDIATGTITTTQIASGTITAGDIASGTITATQIKTGTITATQIAANTITSNNIKAGTITASDIKTGTITGTQIAAGTITADNIKAGSITTGTIAAGSVTGTQIAAGTITAGNIKTGAITSTQIASGTITTNNIKAGTITANNIATGTITSTQIATRSIEAIDIKAGTITGNEIKAGSIKANNIEANSISTNHIQTGAITTAKIQANAITGNLISASTRINIGSVSGHFCGISGVSGQFGFWAGAPTIGSTGADAPFRVDRNGTVYANKLILGGTIPSQITNAQNTANSASSAASAAQGTANTANSNASAAQSTANTANSNASAAQSTANSASSAASAAQNAANTANGGVSAINGKLYVNQSKIQIQSARFTAGSVGWAIDQDGTCEFNNVIARGQIYAARGTLDNVTINESCVINGTLSANKISGAFTSTKTIGVGRHAPAIGRWVTVASQRIRSNSVPMTIMVQSCLIWNRGVQIDARIRSSKGNISYSFTSIAKGDWTWLSVPSIVLDTDGSDQTLYYELNFKQKASYAEYYVEAQHIVFNAFARSNSIFY